MAGKGTRKQQLDEAMRWRVGAARDLPLTQDNAWDGPAAAASVFNNAPQDQWRRAFLIYDDSAPDQRGSYKLPFALWADGLKASPAGLRAAASRLPQTDAPTEVLQRARAVIDDYMARMEEAALLFQAEVNYLPQSPEMDRTCGNCRWFSDQPNTMPCHLVINSPTTITREGICMRWGPTPAGSTVNAWVNDVSENNPNKQRISGPDEEYEEVRRKTLPAKATALVEALDMSQLSKDKVDFEARTVRQRIIQAGPSKNRRIYPRDVLDKAAPLFEGIKTFADHPSPQERKERPGRRVQETTGWIANVALEEDGLYGTRHFSRNRAGEDVWLMVVDVVEGRAPAHLLGGSINAVGRARPNKDDNTLIVESIDFVDSVDDVTAPAAGGAFLPLVASDEGDLTTALLQVMTFEEYVAARPDFTDRLKKEWQTVRQTEAVAAAVDERDAARSELTEARAQIDTLNAARQAQEAELARLRADLAAKDAAIARKGLEVTLEQSLRRVGLPADWEADLREQLLDADPHTWPAILAREKRKAALAGTGKKVDVHGAPRNEHAAQPMTEDFDPKPREGEDFAAWEKRMARHQAGKG